MSRFQVVNTDENNNTSTLKPCKQVENDFRYNEAVINNCKVRVTNPNETTQETETRVHQGTKISFLSFDANGGQSVLAKVARNMASKVSEDLMSLGEINQEMIETHIIGKLMLILMPLHRASNQNP